MAITPPAFCMTLSGLNMMAWIFHVEYALDSI